MEAKKGTNEPYALDFYELAFKVHSHWPSYFPENAYENQRI
jgi:hypothetical protein